MGCLFSILRAGAGLVLGVVIFVGFLSFLILNNVSDKLLNADFYRNTIDAENTYQRIYDPVLLDDELKDKTAELLGDIQVSHEEIVGLIEKIMPQEYIRAQVEGSIDRIIDYINEDVDVLEAYVDLKEPLENVKPVMFAYMDGRIDDLLVEDPGISACSASAVTDLSNRFLQRFEGLANGEVPTSVPSLEALDPLCRRLVFASTFDLLLASSNLDAETTQLVRSNREALRGPFEDGDTLGMLKVSARFLSEPLIDEAIEKVREDLGEGDRFDLIHQLAEWNDDTTEAEIRDGIEEGRDWISRSLKFGDLTSLIMVIGGAALMGLVFFPRLTGMLRWPGVALLITGVFFFVAGKIAESEVPDRLADVIETSADKVSGVPPSVTDLGGDILISFGSQLTDGFVGPSLTLLVIGAILLGSSFFTVILGRFVPFVK
jgi:hypothetical protein